MKIVQFTPYFPPHKGGLEIVAQTISTYLVKENHCEVINITSSIGQKEYFSHHPKIIYKGKHIGYSIDGYQVLVVPSFEIVHNFPCPKFWRSEFRYILSYVRQQHPDIIQTHTRFFLQTLLGGIVAKWLRKPRVHVEHGSGYVSGYAGYIKFFAWLFDRTLGLRIFRQSDKIITISQTNIPFIKKFTKKPITVIYNPITYEPKKSEPNDVPHIGFVGRLVALKGLDILIRTLKRIEHMTWKCTIVGAGDQRTALEKLTKELGLSSRIVFAGLDDRANWIHKFNVFVNPSYQEGLPTTVIEGLLAECVVVATRVGGTSEISDQKDLVLVTPGDVQELADGLKFALNNYEKLSGLSYDEVYKKFNPRESVEKYYGVCLPLI